MEAKKKDRLSSTSRIWNFIKEDHKFENWLLFALSLILLVLSVYILLAGIGDAKGASVDAFADQYFDISQSGWAIFNKPWKVIVTASIVIVISVGALVYCLWPVCKPSFKELKFVTWTNKKTLFVNSVTVIAFIAFLTVLFYVLDFALIPLAKLVFGN